MPRRVAVARNRRGPEVSARADGPLSPVCLRPSQFRDLWGRPWPSGERKLAAAVIECALQDLRSHRHAPSGPRQRSYVRAYQWVATDDRQWPFSFVNVCDLLQLDAAALRAQLLDAGLSPPRAAAA